MASGVASAAAGSVGNNMSGAIGGLVGGFGGSSGSETSLSRLVGGFGQSRSSNAMTQAQQAAQQAQTATPELSPEEQALQEMSQVGGTVGNVSSFGNMKNGVNSNFNAQVTNNQADFESKPPSELANPLGTPLQPMGAVGGISSAITGGVLPQNGSPFTGQAQMNAGQMFGQTYGGMFAGASKK